MPAFLLVCSGLLLEVCVCRNQFSLQLMLQTLEAGWGSRFQTQLCILDFGDVCLSKCHVKTSNVYNCKRLPSHWSKAGLLYDHLIVWVFVHHDAKMASNTTGWLLIAPE